MFSMDLKGVSKAWSCSTLQAGIRKLAEQPQPVMSEPASSGVPWALQIECAQSGVSAMCAVSCCNAAAP